MQLLAIVWQVLETNLQKKNLEKTFILKILLQPSL